MKKRLLLLTTLIGSLGVQAQTVDSWLPALGNYTRKTCNPQSVSVGNAGTAQVWDFSGTQFLSDVNALVVEPGFGNNFGLSNFPTATRVERFLDIDQTTTVFQYTRSTATVYEDLGLFYNTTQDDSSSFVALDPRTLMQFPMSFGTTFSDIYSFEENPLPGTIHYINGTVNGSVDGTGSLILPGSVNIPSVLRIKLEETYTRTLGIPTPPPVPTGNRTTYIWISTFVPNQILAMHVTDVFDAEPAETNFYYVLPSSVSVNEATKSSTVIAEPFIQNSNLVFESLDLPKGSSILLYSANGQQVSRVELGNNNTEIINLSTLSPGVYLYSIQSPAGLIKSGKFSWAR